ncbi:TetR/AcrR family transcriptional regulator [Isoptericola halotolerans]|uniref:TetR/AcrR family transcriptional regulator n=1 Tax=Isoptericola halotolerans TaxID=300560 RepID=UPI00388DED82
MKIEARTARTPTRPGPGRPRRGEVDARRAEILDAATGLFASRGLAGTTIEAVAAQVGATKRTVYRHFTDKTGLFVAAVERLHEHEQEELHAGTGLEEVAARIVHTLHGDDAVTLHRLVVAEAQQHPGLAEAFFERGPAASITALAQILDARSGADADRADALYTLLLGERHRRRLLGLELAPSKQEALEHARRAIRIVLGDV